MYICAFFKFYVSSKILSLRTSLVQGPPAGVTQRGGAGRHISQVQSSGPSQIIPLQVQHLPPTPELSPSSGYRGLRASGGGESVDKKTLRVSPDFPPKSITLEPVASLLRNQHSQGLFLRLDLQDGGAVRKRLGLVLSSPGTRVWSWPDGGMTASPAQPFRKTR